MPARTPEQGWDLFMTAMNAHDMNAALALYEDGAGMASMEGVFASGQDGIRSQLEPFFAMKAKIGGRVARTFMANDLALIFVEWAAEARRPDGNKINFGGVSTDVLRRQRDGSWLMVIDNPTGTAIVVSAATASA